jgi:hypothetical protein
MLKPDIRERLESSLVSLRDLHERVQRYTGPFDLPEPEDEVRRMVERIVGNDA